MPAPISDPRVSNEDDGTQTTLPRFGDANFWSKNCAMVHLLPEPWTNYGHHGLDCSTLPHQDISVSPSSPTTGKSLKPCLVAKTNVVMQQVKI